MRWHKVLAWCTASALHSSVEAALPGTQCLARKLDCTRGKSQLFHTTLTKLRKILVAKNIRSTMHSQRCGAQRQKIVHMSLFADIILTVNIILSFCAYLGCSRVLATFSEGVCILGDAWSFLALTSKIPPLSAMFNFDADVKKTTARHPM